MVHSPGRVRVWRAAWVTLWSLVMVAMASAQTPRFALWDIEVEGNSTLPVATVERVLYPFLGDGKQLADIDAARAALEAAYHQAGFLTVLVDVPPQQLRQGRVRLLVTEGRIERLKVVGASFHSPAELRTRISQLQAGEVPDFNALQIELAAANTSADLQLSPILRPGHAPGTVEAELRVKDRLPWHGSVEVNDRASANTPHARLSTSLSYDNLWQRGHSVTLDLTTAPAHPGDTTTWHASYLMPWSGGQLAVYGLHSSSAVNAVGGVDVLGAGDVLGLRWYGAPIEWGDALQSWSAGVDRKVFKQQVRIGGEGDSAIQYDTPVRYTPWQLQWQRLQPAPGAEPQLFSLSLNGSWRGIGSHDAQFEDNRYQGRASYIYVRGSWRGHVEAGHGQLAWHTEAQLSSQPLISNEQFALGGVDSVRGYTESAWAGDEGLSMQLEWRLTPLPLAGLADASTPDIGRWTSLVFFDGGWMHLMQTLPQQSSHAAALGAGLGLRWRPESGPSGRWSGAIDLARALRHAPPGHTAWRVHSRLALEF